MKRLGCIFFLVFLAYDVFSQVIIDSCFSSVGLEIDANSNGAYGTYVKKYNEPSLSKFIKGREFGKAIWDGSKWLYDQKGNTDIPFLQGYSSPKINAAIFFIGLAYNPLTWPKSIRKTGFEPQYIAFRLSKKINIGDTLRFTFTYSTNSTGEAFIPIIYTSKYPSLRNVRKAGKLQPAPANDVSWTTDTVVLVAGKKQKNHKWVIFYPYQGQGVILGLCTGEPKDQKVPSIPSFIH